MKHVVIKRLPVVPIVLAIALLVTHFRLCLPAATSRGHPPIHPFWETVAPYLAYSGFVFLPFLDDTTRRRRFSRSAVVLVGSLINGIVACNLMSVRPHIGHVVGVAGILTHHTVEVLLLAGFHAAFIYPAVWVLDSLAANAWAKCRGFSEWGSGPALRFSVPAIVAFVAVCAALFGAVKWFGQLYEAWPGAHWTETCRRNMRMIVIAMQNYEATYGALPPAYVEDADGRPAHSWRVLLLPFIGEMELYASYHFDEPWNGPNNRKLADRLPSQYRCQWESGSARGETSYVVITGEGTAFPGSQSESFSSFRDGLWQTILVVECSNSGISWIEPRDLAFDEMAFAVNPKSGKGIRTLHQGRDDLGSAVVMADGTTRFLGVQTRPELLRALITIRGGELIDDSEF